MRVNFVMARSVIALAVALAGTAAADDWDGDDDAYSRHLHDLTHGSDEAHDLAARPGPDADADWSFVPQDPYSSWEVTIDGLTTPAGSVTLDRLDGGGSSVLQTGMAPTTAGGLSRTLWWANTLPAPAMSIVRVHDADCSKSCTAQARYRVRAYETTYAIPRFNNTGTQVTVLVVQNTRAIARTGTAYFWSAAGTLLGSAPLVMGPHAEIVLNTGTVAPGASGSITIAHDAGYGGIAGKTIGLEPATGFSFDTPGSYKPK